MPPHRAFLLVAAALLGSGLYGVLSRRAIIMVMMGLELMLNGLLLTLVTLWHQSAPHSAQGQVFALMLLTLMAVEAALGLAILIAFWRMSGGATLDGARELRG